MAGAGILPWGAKGGRRFGTGLNCAALQVQEPSLLDPQARALLDLMVANGMPPVHTLTPADARRFYLERRGFTQPEPPAVGEVRELRTDTGLRLRLVRPAATSTAVATTTGL